MQSNNPSLNQREYEFRLDRIKVCGANRGPHDYIPIAWTETESTKTEKASFVTTMMCRVCFTRVSLKTLHENFTEASM